jgi:hypothetical protein
VAVPMIRFKLNQQLENEMEKVLAVGNGGIAAGHRPHED